MSLIGRGAEMARLSALIDGVRTGGGALVVRGEAGIGKSALLAEAAGAASAAGWRVLTTSGVQSETRLPYAGLQQLLFPIRAVAGRIGVRQRDVLRAALGQSDSAVPDAHLAALAVLDLVAEAAARAPVLLLVEDVHWLDPSTADVLAFVARRLGSEPVVLLAAVRSGSASRFDGSGLPELAVPPLADDAAAALLDARAPGLAPALRKRLLAVAAGNPLALTELPRSTSGLDEHDALPAGWLTLTARLELAFSARLSGLPAPTRALLQVAALNDSTSLAEALDAVRPATGERCDAGDVAPAIAARLVEADSGELRFRHPLMRSAIHQSMDRRLRVRVHTALADALSGSDRDDRRTWHRAAAAERPDDDIAAELQATATRAERRGGIGVAVSALELAARLSTDPAARAERLLRAADLAVELGRREVVARLLDEAMSLELSPQHRARSVWIRGGFDEGLRQQSTDTLALAELAGSVSAASDSDLAARILWSAAQRCFWSEPGGGARRRVVAVADGLHLAEQDPYLLAILAYAAPIERGTVVLDQLRRLAPAPGDDARTGRMLGTAALLVGAYDLAQRFSAAAAAGLRAQGRLGLLARAVGAQAWSAVQLADLNVAIPAVEESIALAAETTQPYFYGLMRATEAALAALRGEQDRARALAEEAEAVGLPVGARPVLATVQMARGSAALGGGRFEEAYTQLRRMHDPADPSYQIALRCSTIADLVDAAVHSGNGEAVGGIVRELEAAALQTSSTALHAGLRFARALLANDADAEDRYLAALRADLTGWPFIRARTQLAYGEWLRRQRRAADSRAPLRAAREMFDALGTIPWSDRARHELRASGETSRRRTPDARDQLTPQELQIAQMAAEGLTNRDIGQKLYLSHRTVSSHLYRIFPKLGITSRSELGTVVPRGA